jgi:hypothetical protein
MPPVRVKIDRDGTIDMVFSDDEKEQGRGIWDALHEAAS